MSYSKQNLAFLADKTHFFSIDNAVEYNSLTKERRTKEDMLDVAAATKQDYKFLLENQKTLEAEFTQLFAVLQKQKDENNEMFWAYCYYCASLLESFYKAYSQKSKEEKYTKLKLEIRKRIRGGVESQGSEQSFIEHLQASFLESFQNIMKIPYHFIRNA